MARGVKRVSKEWMLTEIMILESEIDKHTRKGAKTVSENFEHLALASALNALCWTMGEDDSVPPAEFCVSMVKRGMNLFLEQTRSTKH